MSKPQSQTNKFPVQNFVIIIVAFLFIGILFGPNAGQVYTGTSVTGADTAELTNDGNLDTKVRDFSLTSLGGVDGNLNYIEFSPDESMISGSNVGMPLGLYINIPIGVSADGGNIRITDQNNNKLPREVESYVSGDLMVWYKPGVTDSNTVVYRVWYGDETVVEPDVDSTYGSHNVWDNYVAVWLMNTDPSGISPQLIDSTSNGHDGTAYGSMAESDLVKGDYGFGINFDGSNDYFLIQDSLDLNLFNGEYGTVEIGIEKDYNAASSAIISKQFDTGFNRWVQFVAGGADSGGVMSIFDSDSTSSIATTSSIVDNVQTNVVGVFNINNYYKNYVSGAFDGESSLVGITQFTKSTPVLIGARQAPGPNSFYNGRISYIRWSDRERSPGYISTTDKNINNPTAGGVNPFYKSISSEMVAQAIDPGIAVGDDKLYYDGTLTSTFIYSDGGAYIGTSDVSASVEGSLPVIKVGTTQNIKIDHDLQYSITYVPKNMDITSPDMFRANEDMRIDTRLTDASGNPVSNQPLEMRARLFDSDDDRYLDEIISSTSFVIPGKYIKSGKHYQLRLSYNGFEFGGWSNEILADFDVGTEGFTITSSPDKAPEGLAAASFAAASNMVGMAVAGWLDIPIIGDIIKFIADLIGVTL